MQQGGQGALLRVACYMLRAVWVSYNASGGVSEWLMVPLSKSGVRASVPWVRIPPPPPSKDDDAVPSMAGLPCPSTAGAWLSRQPKGWPSVGELDVGTERKLC